MQKFTADRFFDIARFLEVVRTNIENVTEQKGANLDSKLEKSDASSSTGKREILRIKQNCHEIGLSVSCKAADHLLQIYDGGLTLRDVMSRIEQLEQAILWEMQDRLFMYIPPDRAARYDKEQPFGEEVHNKFAAARFDMKEAGSCYASGRWTACVFHLMRTLEIGLIAFAGQFPSVATDKENWHNIIEAIEKQIRETPNDPKRPRDWKAKQEAYSQIANSFMFFKDAWRNYTAHARGKYTEEEADGIYRNVKAFMERLAQAGIKEKDWLDELLV